MKVLKFGGGCLRDAASLLRAASIVREEKAPVVVVVSALYGVTDVLAEAIAAARETRSPETAFIPSLRAHHASAAEAALAKGAERLSVLAAVDAACARIGRLLAGIALLGEASPSAQAEILSGGERMSAALLAAVLRQGGSPARSVQADEIGLAADRAGDEAAIDWAASKPAFEAIAGMALDRSGIPVVTGFFGRDPDGRTATFGRNGSDYSAAIVARGVGAAEVELWKDAAGFMTADPAWVKKARPLPRLSAAAAAELSYFGARVLHARVFEALDGAAVAVRMRDFRSPESPGTIILPGASAAAGTLHSATAKTDIAVLRILGPGVGSRPGVIGLAGSKLAAAGVNILTVLTAQTAINLLVSGGDGERARQSLAAARIEGVERVDLVADAGIVAIVGERLAETAGVAGRFFAALGRAGITAAMVSSGASEAAIYAVVRGREAIPAVRALHDEFF